MPKPKKPALPGQDHGPPDEDDYMLTPIPEHHEANKRRAEVAYQKGILYGVDCQYVHRLIYAAATAEFVDHFITHAINFYAKLKNSRKTQ
jgi:hypothetical protein